MNWRELLNKAEEILENNGDIEEARKLTSQANAMKEIELSRKTDNDNASGDDKKDDGQDDDKKANKPPMPDAKPDEDKDNDSDAKSDEDSKSWHERIYIQRFGEPSKAADQFVKEVYSDHIGQGGIKDYYHLAAAKSAEFGKWLRQHNFEPSEQMKNLLTMTPGQVDDIILSGMYVKDIKDTMIETNDVLGGFIVPEDFRMQVIKRMPAYAVIRPRATVITTSRERINYPTATGGDSRHTSNVRVQWMESEEPENTDDYETNATWGMTGINIYTMIATTKMSRALAEDAYFDIGAYLSEQFAEAAALDEDEKFLVSHGTGYPEGILKNNGTGGPARSEMLTIRSGHDTGLEADNVIQMPLKLDAQYRRSKRSIWVMTKATRAEISVLKDGQDRYYFQNLANPLADGDSDYLRNWAIEESEVLPEFGTENNWPLLHGDPKGYTIADRVGMSVDRYRDGSNAEKDQLTYVMRRRLGGALTKPWCWVAMQVGT